MRAALEHAARHCTAGARIDSSRFCLQAFCIVLGSAIILLAACEKKPSTPATNPGLATQGGSAEAVNTYSDPNLAQLTRELRRWIVNTKQRPSSFDDFVARAKVTVPPPPTGKSYSISKEMRVVLVDH